MASIGLRVTQGAGRPGMLADLFKTAMGDPGLASQLALRKAQIWTEDAQQKAYAASSEKARQEAAKAAQEAEILRANQEVMDAAAGPLGADFRAKVPMPVAVEHTPREAQQLIGPGMPYISPDQDASYAAGLDAADALARVYTHSGGNAARLLAQLDAKAKTMPLTEEEKNLRNQAAAIVAKANLTPLGKDQSGLTFNPVTGKWDQVSVVTDPSMPVNPYPGTSENAAHFNNLLKLNSQMRAGRALSPDQLDQYSVAFNALAGTKWEQREDSAGRLRWIRIKTDPPFGFPSPDSIAAGNGLVAAAAGPPPTAAVATGGAGIVPSITPEGGVVVPRIGGVTGFTPETAADGVVAPTVPAEVPAASMGRLETGDVVQGFEEAKALPEGQAKDARLVPLLIAAFSHIKAFPPEQLPNAFWQVWSNPSSASPGTLETLISQMAPGPAKQYAQMLNQFTLNHYLLSGAAFPGAERPENVKTFVPNAGDDAGTRAQKIEAMAQLINGIHLNAYSTDPVRRHQIQQDAHDIYDVNLHDRDIAPKQHDPHAADTAVPATEIPPMTPDAKAARITQQEWNNMDPAGWEAWK
jgi:hypothetical protein